MAKRNGYNVVACDIEGNELYTSHVTSKVEAGRTAREFLAYSNVYLVDVDDAKYGDCGDRVGMYAKSGIHSAVYVPVSGTVSRVHIRF